MKIAILHYSVSPVVGGVEAVIQAHTRLLMDAGYHVTLVAGAGLRSALPVGADFVQIPLMDSRHPHIVEISRKLESGNFPDDFIQISTELEKSLGDVLRPMDLVMVHNIFTKHFNLPLTAALVHLLDRGEIKRCIAWCHDFTWTSPHSRASVHPGYPWELLKSFREDVTYVTISKGRQVELAGLYHCPAERIKVVYDGVDPAGLFSLSAVGQSLVTQLDLLAADLILLMPVRITQAKNIEFALWVVASLKKLDLQPRLVVTGPPDPHDPDALSYYKSLLDLCSKLGVEREARFVYESGPQPGEGYSVDLQLISELYRVCDVLFMPSHREGFGMPILEAGMIGMPIFSTDIPAANEIGGSEVVRFSPDDAPVKVAELIMSWSQASSTHQLRRRIRQNFTWQAIFQHGLRPLLSGGPAQ